jgi:hypothetical protein
MILFFNLDLLETKTANNPDYMCVALFKLYKGIKVPTHSRNKYPPIPLLGVGSGFLLNPEDFFNDYSTDVIYKAQYIKLAGRRDFTLYRTLGIKYLDLSYYPDILLDNIRTNPLLKIANNTIKFKYEELYGNS